ncbi:hypothetical protein [Clostridium sp. UBA1652]|nr:hypothetical protein [Clostridium sp. UBA1652]
MRKIGLYNSKVEGCECLKDCDLSMRCILVKVAVRRMNTIYS